jgi:hypothetical protein
MLNVVKPLLKFQHEADKGAPQAGKVYNGLPSESDYDEEQQ